MTLDGERALILYDFLRLSIDGFTGDDPTGVRALRFYAIHKHDMDSIVKELEKER